MENIRSFTNQDYLLGACQQFEIGLPWQDRFTKTDAWHGRCNEDQVGQPKQPNSDQSPPSEELELDLASLPGDFVLSSELRDYLADRDKYRQKSPALVKLLNDEIKARMALAKTASEVATLETLRRMETMTASELCSLAMRFLDIMPPEFKAFWILLFSVDPDQREQAFVEFRQAQQRQS